MLPPRKPVLLLLFPFLLLVYLPAVWWWGLPYHLPHDPCKKRGFAPESPPKTEHPLLIVRIPSQTNPICGKRCPKHPVSKTSNQYVPPYATSQESPKERCLKPRTTVWEQDAGCSSHLTPTSGVPPQSRPTSKEGAFPLYRILVTAWSPNIQSVLHRCGVPPQSRPTRPPRKRGPFLCTES